MGFDITRRDMLGGLAAAALPLGARLEAQPAPFLASDIGTLRRVLVHSLAPGDTNHDRLSTDLLPDAETDIGAAVRQHQGLMQLLRAAGTDIVELRDALSQAIDATRPSGVFEAWLRASFPRLAGDPAAATPDRLLGRDPSVRNRLGPDGDWQAHADSTVSTIWTRDSAVMTPRGLLICRANSARRRRENMLLRFVYRHSPLLARYPIVFDAVEEGINIEGGDTMIVDRDTLFLGVGNITDPRVAPLLARRLDMNVLTVQTRDVAFLPPPRPGTNSWGALWPLRVLLLHLDTYFTHVAPRHGLAVPWLLEKAHAEDNPLSRFLRGARADSLLDEKDAEAGLEMLRKFGKVTFYARGTGKKDTLGDLKLVDYLRQQRYRLTFVGGPRPSGDQAGFTHFMEVAYPELRRQAANVVQATPGRVIAYAGNPATKAALEADGIAVDSFEARELWAWHGGPHCLTQPLERG
ncbi:MAG: arginine deiminase family protein [Sphingomonadaceae bacterium]